MADWLDALAARLTPAPVPPEGEGARQAAVAVVVHAERVLLMKRVERAGDPWSGHISLPGGRYQAEDGDLRVTAIRETHEELGVELVGARVLGHLPPLHPRSSGPAGIAVTAFVFVADAAPATVCGPEALAAFWLPMPLAASGAIDSVYRHPGAGVDFPAWTYDGHVIWGLTRRILDLVLAPE